MVRKYGLRLPRFAGEVLRIDSVTQRFIEPREPRAFTVTMLDPLCANCVWLGIQARVVGTAEWFFVSSLTVSTNFTNINFGYPVRALSVLTSLVDLVSLGRVFLDTDGVYKWRYVESINDLDTYEFRATAYQSGQDVLESLIAGPSVIGPPSLLIDPDDYVRACTATSGQCASTLFGYVGKNALFLPDAAHPLLPYLSGSPTCSTTCPSSSSDNVYVDLSFSMPAFTYDRTAKTLRYADQYVKWMEETVRCGVDAAAIKQIPVTSNLIGVARLVNGRGGGELRDSSNNPLGVKFSLLRSTGVNPMFDVVDMTSSSTQRGYNSTGITASVVTEARSGGFLVSRQSDGRWTNSQGNELADGDVISMRAYVGLTVARNATTSPYCLEVYGAVVALPQRPCSDCEYEVSVPTNRIEYPNPTNTREYKWVVYGTLSSPAPPSGWTSPLPYVWKPGFPQAISYCNYFWMTERTRYTTITDMNYSGCEWTYVRYRLLLFDCRDNRYIDITSAAVEESPTAYAGATGSGSTGTVGHFTLYGSQCGGGPCNWSSTTVEKLTDIENEDGSNAILCALVSSGINAGCSPPPVGPSFELTPAPPSAVKANRPVYFFPRLQGSFSPNPTSDAYPVFVEKGASCPSYAKFYPAPKDYGALVLPASTPLQVTELAYSVTRHTGSRVVFGRFPYRAQHWRPSDFESWIAAYNINNSGLVYPFHGSQRQNGKMEFNILMPKLSESKWIFNLDKRLLLSVEVAGAGQTVVRPAYGPAQKARWCASDSFYCLGVCTAQGVHPAPNSYIRDTLLVNKMLDFEASDAEATASNRTLSAACLYDVQYGGTDGDLEACAPLDDIVPCYATLAEVPAQVVYTGNQLLETCVQAQTQFICKPSGAPTPVWAYLFSNMQIENGFNFLAFVGSATVTTPMALPPQGALRTVFFAPRAGLTVTTQINQQQPAPIDVFQLDGLSVRPTIVLLEFRIRHDYPADLRIILRAPGGSVFFDSGIDATNPSQYGGVGNYIRSSIAPAFDGAGGLAIGATGWYDPMWFAFHTYYFAQQNTFDGVWTIQILNYRTGDVLDVDWVRLGFVTNSAPFVSVASLTAPPAPTNVVAAPELVDGLPHVRLTWTAPVRPEMLAYRYRPILGVTTDQEYLSTFVSLPATPSVLIPLNQFPTNTTISWEVSYSNAAGWGEEAVSNVLTILADGTATTTPPIVAPLPPRGVVLALGQNRQITAYWGAPENAAPTIGARAVITGYRITFKNLTANTTATTTVESYRRWYTVVSPPWAAGDVISAEIIAVAVDNDGNELLSDPEEAEFSVVATNSAPPELDASIYDGFDLGPNGDTDFPVVINGRVRFSAPTAPYTMYVQYSGDGGETWRPSLSGRLTFGSPELTSTNINATYETNQLDLQEVGYGPEFSPVGGVFRVRVWAGLPTNTAVNGLLSYPRNFAIPYPPGPPPTVSIQGSATVLEGNAGQQDVQLTFVRMTNNMNQATRVTFVTEDLAPAPLSAKAGSDYIGVTSGSFMFLSGEAVKTVVVTRVIGDTRPEQPFEKFGVKITHINSVPVAGAAVEVIITDDD